LAWGTLTNPLGDEHQTWFSAEGNPVVEVAADEARVRCEYDALGRLRVREGPRGARCEYRYDRKGLLVESRSHSGRAVRFAYDAMDLLTRVTDEAGGELRIERGRGGVPNRVVLPDRSEIRYRFDSENELTTVLNEAGAAYGIVRDARGRVVEEV